MSRSTVRLCTKSSPTEVIRLHITPAEERHEKNIYVIYNTHCCQFIFDYVYYYTWLYIDKLYYWLYYILINYIIDIMLLILLNILLLLNVLYYWIYYHYWLCTSPVKLAVSELSSLTTKLLYRVQGCVQDTRKHQNICCAIDGDLSQWAYAQEKCEWPPAHRRRSKRHVMSRENNDKIVRKGKLSALSMLLSQPLIFCYFILYDWPATWERSVIGWLYDSG